MNVLDQAEGQGWHAYHGDSCEVLSALPPDSIDYSVFSPPFASLYTYTNSDRDLGNSRNSIEFFEHFSWLMPQMFRVIKPGRLMSVHCFDMPTLKGRDGYIGLDDFPGDLIRCAKQAGWIWHAKVTIPTLDPRQLGRITIWKDPVTAMQRTHAKGLLYKELRKDSAASRMGIPDYVLTFTKPGENANPIAHDTSVFSVEQWQQWASPIWATLRGERIEGDATMADFAADVEAGDTLQRTSAREHEEEKHICPLQLEVIRRCVRMWSNPGDTVLTPFGGIGSEGYVSVQEGRRAILCELKASYYKQLVANMGRVVAKQKQGDLFAALGGAK